jgi:heptaprenyl diphosphate synthase
VTAYLSGAIGKRARAALLLTCAARVNTTEKDPLCSNGSLGAAADNLVVPTRAVDAAAAIELFHLATLVHDDIIDDTPLRRGVASVQSAFDKRSAVIVGDYLLCLAAASAMKSAGAIEDDEQRDIMPTLHLYLPSLTKICEGEFAQWVNEGNYDLALNRYIRIISGKTAELFRLSAVAGTMAGKCGNERFYGRLGWYIGMIFQIVDDCKDFEFSESAAKKPVRQDLPQGVITLPLIMGMSKEPRLALLVKDMLNSNEDAEKIAVAVRDAKGVVMAKEIANRYAQKAGAIIAKISDGLKARLLTEILDKTLNASTDFEVSAK